MGRAAQPMGVGNAMVSIPQVNSRQRLVSAALLCLAELTSDDLNPYLRRHRSGHVALSGQWGEFDVRPELVDRLDVDALASDVLQHALGRTSVPVNVAATVFAREYIRTSASSDRSLLRQLAAACLTCQHCSLRYLCGVACRAWNPAVATSADLDTRPVNCQPLHARAHNLVTTALDTLTISQTQWHAAGLPLPSTPPHP
jgi:hypothetical protein